MALQFFEKRYSFNEKMHALNECLSLKTLHSSPKEGDYAWEIRKVMS